MSRRRDAETLLFVRQPSPIAADAGVRAIALWRANFRGDAFERHLRVVSVEHVDVSLMVGIGRSQPGARCERDIAAIVAHRDRGCIKGRTVRVGLFDRHERRRLAEG